MDNGDFGDDDAFDGIPDNTLYELENAAKTSTQKPSTNPASVAAERSKVQTYATTGLSRTSRPLGRDAWRPPQPRKQPAVPNAPPASAPAPPSSDYGFEDEDVIDLDEPSMVIQSGSALPTRHPANSLSHPPAPRYAPKPPLDPETEAAFAAADAELGARNSRQWNHASQLHPAPLGNGNGDIHALQARIAELESQQLHLRQSEEEARHAAQSKAGEIAIVRANHDKSSKEFERRIAVMQKLHAEESARQKAELESGKKEREKMETRTRFLQHDLAQEAERVKGLRGTGKARNSAQHGADSGTATPRASRRAGMGDGFDDGEVSRLVSPSKSRDKARLNEQTPKAGSKRKRQAMDSPVPAPALSLSGRAQPVREETATPLEDSMRSAPLHDDRFDFMQRILHHRPREGAERTMETLTKLSFPSTNDPRTMSSMLLDSMLSSTALLSEPLVLKLSHAVLHLWSRCLEEEFYLPVPLLVDLFNFTVAFETASTLVQLTADAVPICMRTIDLIASHVAKASRYPAYADSEEYKKIELNIGQHIHVDEVMDCLSCLCDAASLQPDSSAEFWRTVEFTFMLQMLHKSQPLSQIFTALRMLSTSAMDASFGPICGNHSTINTSGDSADAARQQTKQEKDMLDRLTILLFEMPEVPKGEPPYTDEEVQDLRLHILAVFRALQLTDHGTMLLAQHPSAIGRLVKLLEAQVTRLYTAQPSLGLEKLSLGDPETSEHSSQPSSPTLHDLITQTINTTVRLLYHLLHNCTPPVNLQQKLRVVRGGYHKFLLSFTRIAFSDQLVLEAGLENEVIEAAHTILDETLSPEEGEAVMRAVETPRGTKGREEVDGSEEMAREDG
ncbi:hypothetical protein BDY17DRAFT_304195 [Neohortaea acidophila]|uniref:Uncharacterized protein n=1 Tax=Neohortaea acidophila TaxID=245834 RepID=A0A6A6PHS8_9PEZI|nr:uncharacterized protein BDY17DRAFT_304195 [Neohortaea acidophila]KAF2479560.1 hypothetical protein BDY17DRAFT_304195 [Neohortaea acidophila]